MHYATSECQSQPGRALVNSATIFLYARDGTAGEQSNPFGTRLLRSWTKRAA